MKHVARAMSAPREAYKLDANRLVTHLLSKRHYLLESNLTKEAYDETLVSSPETLCRRAKDMPSVKKLPDICHFGRGLGHGESKVPEYDLLLLALSKHVAEVHFQ